MAKKVSGALLRATALALIGAAGITGILGSNFGCAGCEFFVPASSGFEGDLEAVYPGGLGGARDGDGCGYVAVGGGAGRVSGAWVTAYRTRDDAIIGTSTTDALRGLITLRVCPDTGPIMIELRSSFDTRWDDPVSGERRTWAQGRLLHALADRYDEHIGVTALTEAAYRYAINQFIADPVRIAAGQDLLRTSLGSVPLTTAQVRQANQVVLDEIDRLLPAELRLTSLKALPAPLYTGVPDGAVKNSRYGVAAAVSAGWAAVLQAYRPATELPAFDVAEALARDLTDGVIDGFALDGTPAASGSAAYDTQRLPVALEAGAKAVALRFGRTTLGALGSDTTDVAFASTAPGGNVAGATCEQTVDDIALRRDGSVDLRRREPLAGQACADGGAVTPLSGVAAGVRFLRAQGRQAVVVRDDGNLFAWGDATCGRLGNGAASGRATAPVAVAGLTHVTSFASGLHFALARDTDGRVFGWGADTDGALGLGAAPTYDLAACDLATGSAGAGPGANLAPRAVPGLANIVHVGADARTAYAVDGLGRVHEWGLVGGLPQPVPAPRAGLDRIVAVAPAAGVSFALRAGGTVWGWGANPLGNFGDGSSTPKPVPVQLAGLAGIVQIAADAAGGVAALQRDGTVKLWDGTLYRTPTTPQVEICSVPDRSAVTCSASTSAALPPMRHIAGAGTAGVQMTGVDGAVYLRRAGSNRVLRLAP